MSITKRMAFDDNAVIAQLYGHHDSNLVRIEALTGAQLNARGNQMDVTGEGVDVLLEEMWKYLSQRSTPALAAAEPHA